ncbi:hypothetical protein K493DRAFT_274936 [Basidiobolus meristosporus CBS 931.73]|uniref:Uncharacterized protein n=1 Tax=Basidiobolus meristosporus CBS 931.73 TaxID=1314790 RepID=A0A1Y1Z629_9FUNG|nr:hypothetical protein K493DRAFT_274936 [Basidiobolus meristosporus CBS 931.73]|eukprot:ORY05666.1 hypothetical protein K493DRAFT_274936 [Basidiobolus meristosporus CBS 931.73]
MSRDESDLDNLLLPSDSASQYDPSPGLNGSTELSTSNDKSYLTSQRNGSDPDTGSSSSMRSLSQKNSTSSGESEQQGSPDNCLDTLAAAAAFKAGRVSPKSNGLNKPINGASKNPDVLEDSETPPSALSNFPGLYSSSGFDMITVLSKVVTRPNPQIHIGPIDMGCAFIAVDARRFDFPIVYASQSFEKLTGYSSAEVVGRNCRFLQAPDGQVTLGSRRRFTDNNAIWDIKNHIQQAKEIQISLVNYKKGGQPFVNLVTIIPISLYGDEITHFVGFLVDMVEQPHIILEKMREGTYHPGFSSPIPTMSLLSNNVGIGNIDASVHCSPAISDTFVASKDIFDILGVSSQVDEETAARMWNMVLLEESDDFIHVLSLKGVFLYCSPSCKRMLEYEPEELVSTSLSSICQPNDLIPVLRELKEVSNDADSISLVYRIKRKKSGYMWFEASGRIYHDKSKVRKYAILSGRPRPMYRLSREVVEGCGGLTDNEFWTKLSLDGMITHVTSFCRSSISIAPDDLKGTSLYQCVRSNRTTALTRALQQAREGITVKLQHSFQDCKGQYIDVVSTFYPSTQENEDDVPFILCQSKVIPIDDEGSSESSDVSSSAPSPLTNQIASETDNMFSMLSIDNQTNWQYELHQLRIANKKLRDELESFEGSHGRKRKRKNNNRYCAVCLRKDSVEWRKDPNGSGRLCDSCG